MLSSLIKIMTIALMCYFVVLAYLSSLRHQDQLIIISLIIFGIIFCFMASYMNYVFGYMNHRRGYGGAESYPDIIWKVLGVLFIFIGVYLLVTHNIVTLGG